MARRHSDNPTSEALGEIESWGDRLVERVSANPRPVLISIAAVLAVAGGIGGYQHLSSNRLDQANAALERVREDYLIAMGASVGDLDVVEPANPAAAEQIRSQYIAKFIEVAKDYAGQPTAALAWLDAGTLYDQMGADDEALEVLNQALEETAAGDVLRSLIYDRVARLHERAGRWTEAAAAYEAAGSTSRFPLRHEELAQAARCYAEAGNRAQALALFKRIQAEAPQVPLPEHLQSRLRALEADSADAVSAADSTPSP